VKFDPQISFGHADVGEVTLHYATAGRGERIVLLLHGFPEFWYSWRRQLVSLSDEYTVVAPDLRGYNLSDKPQDIASYSSDKLVADIAGLIRHFGATDAAVIGHDWGAAIAWAFARQHPEMTWKLAALQVPPPDVWKRNMTLKQALASWYMFFFQLPWVPEWIASRNDFARLESSLRETAAVPVFTDYDIAIYRESWHRSDRLRGPINYYRANIIGRLFGRDKAPSHRITAPTLFIYGEKDHAILPTTTRDIAATVDGPYREHRIPNSGHWAQQEASDEVTEVLREFLRD
jgi:pimeloyl-ACP methyl ester carboxylesterase